MDAYDRFGPKIVCSAGCCTVRGTPPCLGCGTSAFAPYADLPSAGGLGYPRSLLLPPPPPLPSVAAAAAAAEDALFVEQELPRVIPARENFVCGGVAPCLPPRAPGWCEVGYAYSVRKRFVEDDDKNDFGCCGGGGGGAGRAGRVRRNEVPCFERRCARDERGERRNLGRMPSNFIESERIARAQRFRSMERGGRDDYKAADGRDGWRSASESRASSRRNSMNSSINERGGQGGRGRRGGSRQFNRDDDDDNDNDFQSWSSKCSSCGEFDCCCNDRKVVNNYYYYEGGGGNHKKDRGEACCLTRRYRLFARTPPGYGCRSLCSSSQFQYAVQEEYHRDALLITLDPDPLFRDCDGGDRWGGGNCCGQRWQELYTGNLIRIPGECVPFRVHMFADDFNPPPSRYCGGGFGGGFDDGYY